MVQLQNALLDVYSLAEIIILAV